MRRSHIFYLLYLTALLMFGPGVFASAEADETSLSVSDSAYKPSLAEEANNNYREALSQWKNNQYDKAISLFKLSVKANQLLKNVNALRILYSNIGMVYADKEDYESSLQYFRKSLAISEQKKDDKEILPELFNLGIALQRVNRHSEAIVPVAKAVEMAKSTNDMANIKRGYGMLAESYDKAGKADKAIEYYALFATLEKHTRQLEVEATKKDADKRIVEANNLKDQANKENKQTSAVLDKTAEKLKTTEKLTKSQEVKLKIQTTEILERDIVIEHKNTLNNIYIGGIVVALLFILVIFWSYWLKKRSSEQLATQNKEIMRQQEMIERKNQNITQSISYAQRIQEAMLPSEQLIREKLPESFIMFKPRDIVSGDFYWLATDRIKSAVVRNEELGDEDDIFIAAADCTGHGVPGAFMSMIGYNLLNEIVARKIYSPDKILEALNNGVKNALKQETTMNNDGMDISICRIRKKKGVIEFSGAMSPICYCRDGKMHEIKGGLFSVGGDELELGTANYQSETIKIDGTTTFYLFSDGYYDQFGGENGRKFMSKRFKDLLFSIHHLPMNEQQQQLEQKFNEWMGDNEQIDDVLVIGFRL